MSEFRQDRTSGCWTIIAPERNFRPHEPQGERRADDRPFETHPSCPFCSGNEAMLPNIVEEAPAGVPPGWLTRVVPNRFPILEAGHGTPTDPPVAGYGVHEVIIETPRHGADLPNLSPIEMEAVVATWHRRFAAALRLPDIATALVFRNHGRAAGASLGHSHSQLVAMDHVPPRLRRSLEWACARYDEDGNCVTCRELDLEHEAGDRVVQVNDEFVVLVRFAASSPLEQWIVPRRHRPSFGDASGQELAVLAETVQQGLVRLKAVEGDVAYNLVIEPGSNGAPLAQAAHWSLRIIPDFTTPGGFELLSGLTVNPSSPEHDASRLRDCRIGCI